MRNALYLVAFLAVSPAFAGTDAGLVESVDKKGFTIKCQRNYKHVYKRTLAFGPTMGKKEGFDGLGVTPDKIEVGKVVQVQFSRRKEDGVLECSWARILVFDEGPREVDFSPMRTKGKDTVAACTVEVQLSNRIGIDNRRPYGPSIVFKDGTSLKRVRDEIKNMLVANGWKVKTVGDYKLIVEARYEPEMRKDEPVIYAKVTAKGLPKEKQPKVQGPDPSK